MTMQSPVRPHYSSGSPACRVHSQCRHACNQKKQQSCRAMSPLLMNPFTKHPPGRGYGDNCDAHSKPLSPCQRQPRLLSAKCQKKLRMLPGTRGDREAGTTGLHCFIQGPTSSEGAALVSSPWQTTGQVISTAGRSRAEDRTVAGRGSEDSLAPGAAGRRSLAAQGLSLSQS